ncbi:MAG TPA: methionyl-tRNA formyltransferase [Syntrophomonadaceae bacterium]|nr:methionyl-tRNA formyltransferase [Syntrophomonadaceae bacterium]
MSIEPECLKIIFMGTSRFAVPALEALVSSSHTVTAVVSQPDRPRGRGKQVQPTPVKEAALRNNCTVYQFPRIKEPKAVETLAALQPDLLVVVSFGQIISSQLLQVPPLGCINLHASLLPYYRGAAPVQRAIMAGEKKTGISTMLMDVGVDTGDILLQEEVSIDSDMDHGQLEALLAERGAGLLVQTIEKVARKEITGRKQDDRFASYAAMISREDEIIDWSAPALAVHNRIRALSPSPGAYTAMEESRLKIFRSRVFSPGGQGISGQVLGYTQEGMLVQTGEGSMEILEVQKEGKKRMSIPEFIKGFRLPEGLILHC